MGVGRVCKGSDEHLGRGVQAGNLLRAIQTRIRVGFLLPYVTDC